MKLTICDSSHLIHISLCQVDCCHVSAALCSAQLPVNHLTPTGRNENLLQDKLTSEKKCCHTSSLITSMSSYLFLLSRTAVHAKLSLSYSHLYFPDDQKTRKCLKISLACIAEH